MAKKQKRGRGRPAKYTGNEFKHIFALVRKLGLTGAQEALRAEGVDEKRVPSIVYLSKKAAELKITVARGRRPGPVEVEAEAA